MGGQRTSNVSHIRSLEPVALAQLGRPVRAMQDEHRLTVADHMNMGRTVVVRIDHDPKAADAQDCGHAYKIAKPKRLGKARG